MRRAFALLVAAAVAAGSSVAVPARASAQCAFVVVRHDRAYFLYGSRRASEIRPGAALGGALEPGCSDMAGVPAPAAIHVTARRIAGVSPDVAVLVRGQTLVATGYLPRAAGFPVAGLSVDETKGCRIGTTASLSGAARVWPAGIELTSGGRPTVVLVDTHTVFARLSRHGLPYIGDRQRVRIAAVHCGRKIVARRIVRAGRIVPATTAEDMFGADWRGSANRETFAHSHAWWAAGAAAVTVALAGGVLVLRRRTGASHRS